MNIATTMGKDSKAAFNTNFSAVRLANIVDHVHKVRLATAKNHKLTPPSKKDTEILVGWIISDARDKNIDPCVALAVAETESGFMMLKSSAGACGYFQLMPDKITGLDKKFKNFDRNKPRHNVQGGVRLLSDIRDYYNGDWLRALVAYNAGSGNVSKAIKRGLHGQALDQITDNRCYARTVLGKTDVYRNLSGQNSYALAQYYHSVGGSETLAQNQSPQSKGRTARKTNTNAKKTKTNGIGNTIIASRTSGKSRIS